MTGGRRPPEPLRTYTIIGVDLGLGLTEFQQRSKRRSVFDDPQFPSGYVQVRRYKNPLKSHWSNRDLPMTQRVRETLQRLCAASDDELIFANVWKSTLEHQMRRYRKDLGFSRDFVLHSFRHTYGTRLGEDGAGAAVRQLMGHQSMTTSQKYVKRLDLGIAELVERMDATNRAAREKSLLRVLTFSGTPTILTGRKVKS